MAHAPRPSRQLRDALVAAAFASFALAASGAESPKKEPEQPHRFYAGVNLSNLDFSDAYAGVNLHDSSVGLGVFGGAYLKDRLSLELSYDSFTAIDLHDVAGSGVTHFDMKTERRTVSLAVVREVSLREVFDWKRDWRVFGMAGAYRSSISRSVNLLGTGQSTSGEGLENALLGGGVLYRVGPVDLRGYFRQFGVMGDKEAREFGLVVQRRF